MQQLQFIVIGDPASPSFTFEGDDILSTSGDFSVDMIGAELCTDVMEAEISYDDTDGTLRALPWATPVYFFRGEHLEGKLYLVSVTRTGRTAYRLRTASAAGILEYDTFYGGLYAGETFRTVVEQIVKTNALQPYDGIYVRLFREKDDSPDMIAGIGMGSYTDQAKTVFSDDGAYLLAHMSSKLTAKIKIDGFSNQSYNLSVSNGATPQTTFRSILLGAVTDPDAANSLKYHRYGMYMQMSRADVSDPFPSFGEVFFVYGEIEISLGTPSSAEDAVYEIEVDPWNDTAVINNVSYSIYTDVYAWFDPCALHVYGGGARLYDENGSIYASIVPHHCELEAFYYTVRNNNFSQDHTLQADYTAVCNVYTDKIGVYDYVTYKVRENIPNASILSEDLTPYDVSTYGGSVLFNNQTDFQKDVLDRLSYADGIGILPIYGWIPVGTKREALQQLLFATGVILIKDENGVIVFTAPSAQSAKDISENAVYDEGSEDQLEHINSVELTEHGYVLNQASELETIYESYSGASDGKYYIATFGNAPAKQEGSSGLTCLYANCNAAIVTGTGTLTGRTYLHTNKGLRFDINNYPDGHGVSVSDATLVTLMNGENVLDRLVAYYGVAQKIHVDIAMDGERCGLKYNLTSAFGDAFSGFLVRASKRITSIVRAACEFIKNYAPPQIGDIYTNYVILTGNGSWTVPESVFEKETPRIHVVLIGGGRGGDGGFAGSAGAQPAASSSGVPAEGGAPGDSGTGGRIFEVTITDPAASYAYSCGQGGAGGGISYSHSQNNPGSDGGDTTFSGGSQSYSSLSGSSSENGIANSFTGELYAARLVHSWIPDRSALSGGGAGGYQTDDHGIRYQPAKNCVRMIMNTIEGLYGYWQAGGEGASYIKNGAIYASGGGGGGGGYGEAGSNGSPASYSGGKYRSGNGGKGGDATEKPPKATEYNSSYYGYGGLGGGGGGGGGSGGWVWAGASHIVGTGGAGGYGGRGGDGGDGCVLIYY